MSRRPAQPAQPNAKSVQEYIDELPVWPDGTSLKSAPMTAMQWRIWGLAAAGKFFEGFVVFMTGVALPLIVREFQIGAAEKGIVSAASLFGILLGAILLGGLSDYFGRKRMFIAEMIIFCAFLALLIVCTNFLSLVICLFGLGMALGCDYPTAHMIISESIPSTSRGKLVLGAFGFQALGALGGTGIGCLCLVLVPSLDAWRWMFATALVPALIVTIGRFFIPESANWLAVRGAQRGGRACCPAVAAPRAALSSEHRAAAQDGRGRRRRVEPTRLSWRCSTAAIAAPRSSPRCPGSSRIWAPMASASSRRPSWQRRWAAARIISAA